jgi:hypothetical protein
MNHKFKSPQKLKNGHILKMLLASYSNVDYKYDSPFTHFFTSWS